MKDEFFVSWGCRQGNDAGSSRPSTDGGAVGLDRRQPLVASETSYVLLLNCHQRRRNSLDTPLNVAVKIPLTDITLSRQTDPYANAQSDRHRDRAASDRPTGHVTGGICALGIGSTVHHKASPETDEAFVFWVHPSPLRNWSREDDCRNP